VPKAAKEKLGLLSAQQQLICNCCNDSNLLYVDISLIFFNIICKLIFTFYMFKLCRLLMRAMRVMAKSQKREAGRGKAVGRTRRTELFYGIASSRIIRDFRPPVEYEDFSVTDPEVIALMDKFDEASKNGKIYNYIELDQDDLKKFIVSGRASHLPKLDI